jgi:uncharacterized protein (DUF983 family)
MAPTRWQPDRQAAAGSRWPMPSLGVALKRGLLCRCPSCGQGPVFRGYLTVIESCRHCGAPLGAARADDAPPYFTILITGHIVIGLMLWMQKTFDPSVLTLTAVCVPLTIALVLGLLRPVKGATVGLMLTLNMLKPDDDPPPLLAPHAAPLPVPPRIDPLPR